jgi:hypothetical protein
MDYIICDLDGTLADISHREHHAQGHRKNWQKFFEGIPDDALAEVVADILRHYIKTHKIVLVSGRPEHTREHTESWLKKHVPWLKPIHLHMRPSGDFRPDNIVKAEIYEEQIKPEYGEPFFVLDDRDKVVKMWREKGLICLQVAEGNF